MGFVEIDESYNLSDVKKTKMQCRLKNMNILLTSVGRRGYMVKYFQDALAGSGKVHAGNSIQTYALSQADVSVITPGIYDGNYISFLETYCKQHDISAIIPLFDIDIPILAKHARLFEAAGVTVMVPSEEFAEICNDKWKTYCFLSDNGIATPKSYLTEDAALQALHQNEICYPLVVKPRWGMGSIGVFIADDEDELRVFCNKVRKAIAGSYLKYESAADIEHSVLIQEKINGDEFGLDVINDLNGTNVTVVTKQKLAMRAGETDIAKVYKNSRLEEVGRLLGRLSGHKGNLDVDCFIADNQVYVLEMNCRFGGQYPFSHLAGVNLPAQIVRWLQGKATEEGLISVNMPCVACKELQPVVLEKII